MTIVFLDSLNGYYIINLAAEICQTFWLTVQLTSNNIAFKYIRLEVYETSLKEYKNHIYLCFQPIFPVDQKRLCISNFLLI